MGGGEEWLVMGGGEEWLVMGGGEEWCGDGRRGGVVWWVEGRSGW